MELVGKSVYVHRMKSRIGTTVIAGATGLIGRQLTSSMIAAQKNVVVLTRNRDAGKLPHHSRLRFVHWDGKSAGDWTQHLEDASSVINLAGQSIGERRWSTSRKEELLNSRVEPTQALVHAIRVATSKPEVLINASAVGFYGNVPGGVVAEDHPAGSDFLGRTCAAWESAATEAQEEGVRVVLLRSGIVLDKRGGALERMLHPFKMFVGGPLGSGNQWFPWIHNEDELRAILFTLENETMSGPVNLVAPQAATMREFSRALGTAMHRPAIFTVPAFVLKAVLGEMSDLVLSGQHAIPEKLLKAGFEFRFPALAGALQDVLR